MTAVSVTLTAACLSSDVVLPSPMCLDRAAVADEITSAAQNPLELEAWVTVGQLRLPELELTRSPHPPSTPRVSQRTCPRL